MVKNKIFITGHKGLIGSSLFSNLKNDYQLYGYDISDVHPSIMPKNVDTIIHCASYCIIRDIIKNPSLMMDNINIAYKIMEKARLEKSKVILLSSSRLNSDYYSPYIVSKKFMENLSITYKDCYNVDSIIVRPETIWGYHERDNRVIPGWIKKAKLNEDIIVYGNRMKELTPLFIEDFTNEIIKIVKDFNSFNNKVPITITGESMKVTDIIDIIKDFYNSKSKVVFLDPELSQPQITPDRRKADIVLKNRLKENLR